ncbi:glutaminase [Anaerococcus sp. Marseille-P3915]|uniref:glutaminase n=1 Tax=Anaerococcus sp. Marseille-P3915 TaxID=2057799 RepID=UPI000D0B0EA1|nr:glutaminase [Anaerococcus sp. Marseille-P3915]
MIEIKSIVKSERFIGKGEVASYIPELLNVDSETFVLAITSTTGDTYYYGEADKELLKILSYELNLNIFVK